MGDVTHEQANLMLRLYEMRREPRLRQARTWYMEKYSANTPEELMQKYPPGTEENASLRMAVSYWEMCASLVNRGLIDDQLFFENNGEIWGIWEKLKAITPAWRAAMGNPTLFANLESCVQRLEAWRERMAPGSNEKMRQRLAQMTQALAQAAKP